MPSPTVQIIPPAGQGASTIILGDGSKVQPDNPATGAITIPAQYLSTFLNSGWQTSGHNL